MVIDKMYYVIDCELRNKYLSGYAGSQRWGFSSVSEAKAKCLTGINQSIKSQLRSKKSFIVMHYFQI